MDKMGTDFKDKRQIRKLYINEKAVLKGEFDAYELPECKRSTSGVKNNSFNEKSVRSSAGNFNGNRRDGRVQRRHPRSLRDVLTLQRAQSGLSEAPRNGMENERPTAHVTMRIMDKNTNAHAPYYCFRRRRYRSVQRQSFPPMTSPLPECQLQIMHPALPSCDIVSDVWFGLMIMIIN